MDRFMVRAGLSETLLKGFPFKSLGEPGVEGQIMTVCTYLMYVIG